MSNTILKKSVLLLLVLFSAYFTNAQQIKCGPYIVDKVALQKALNYENTHKGLATSPLVIRVFFRIVDPDGGKLLDITESQINNDFKHLVGAYAADNICFVNMGFDHLYNTALDTFNISNDNYKIFLPYGIQNCITIFYVDQIGGVNGSSGGGASGVTYGLGTAWTIVEKAYIGLGTLEHEVGHCFGLMHTFDFVNGNGLEDIDGSNGSSSADLITDTKADPYAFNNEDKDTCFHSASCVYTGSCKDPKGRRDYSPPYTNLMSYWCKGFYPTYTITSGQYTRVNSYLNTIGALQVTESQSTVIESNINVSSGYHMNSAATTLTTSGTVIFSNNVIASLGAGQTVFLEPGFDAAPGTGGRVFIRHAFCDTTSNGYSFTSSKVATADNQLLDKLYNDALIAYPNPANSFINLSFNLEQDESYAVVELYNMNMRKVRETNLGSLQSGKHLITIDLHDLTNGIYAVVLQLPHSQMRTKIVLLK